MERARCCKWQSLGVICYDSIDNQHMVFLRLSLWYFMKIIYIYLAVKLGCKSGFRFHLCNPLNHAALSSVSYLHLYVKFWVLTAGLWRANCFLGCIHFHVCPWVWRSPHCFTCYPTYPLSISQKCICISCLLMAVLLLSLSMWIYTVCGSFTFILMGCHVREEMNDCD